MLCARSFGGDGLSAGARVNSSCKRSRTEIITAGRIGAEAGAWIATTSWRVLSDEEHPAPTRQQGACVGVRAWSGHAGATDGEAICAALHSIGVRIVNDSTNAIASNILRNSLIATIINFARKRRYALPADSRKETAPAEGQSPQAPRLGGTGNFTTRALPAIPPIPESR